MHFAGWVLEHGARLPLLTETLLFVLHQLLGVACDPVSLPIAVRFTSLPLTGYVRAVHRCLGCACAPLLELMGMRMDRD